MTTVDAPLGVEQLNGTLDLKGDRVQISSLSAVVGGGKVSVGGSIRYRPNVAFDLALQGEAIRLRYPQGLRSILDTNLTWSGTTEDSTLVGRVLIDSLSFTQTSILPASEISSAVVSVFPARRALPTR